MQNNSLISILVPVYNAAQYLPRCIESIINQTYKNLEIICVDDGSTDNSLKILRSYQSKDSRILVIHQKNTGVVGAKKTAMRLAQGDYIGYVDSDDWIEPTMYENLITYMKDNDADIVCCGTYKDYSNYTNIVTQGYKEGIYEKEDIIDSDNGYGLVSLKEIDKYFITNYLWDKVYKREVIFENQLLVPDDISDGDDTACVYPTILVSNKIGILEKCYYHYCIRDNSLSQTTINGKEKYVKLFQYIREKLSVQIKSYPSLNSQIKMMEYSHKLLGNPKEIISYSNGILFPFGKIYENANIVIYGDGRFGNQLQKILKEYEKLNIVGVVDEYKDKKGLLKIADLKLVKYDFIIIGILKSVLVKEVVDNLIKNDVPQKKIVYIDAEMLIEYKGLEASV